MLVRDGVSGGAAPSLHVLEFGPLNLARNPTDILPYLPMFRHYFAPLPQSSAEMQLKACKVPIMDLECVTGTAVKVRQPAWYLNIKKGEQKYITFYLVPSTYITRTEAVKLADKEFTSLASSWEKPEWDELDWDRVKELQIIEVLTERQKQLEIAQSCECLQCPRFLKHVSTM